YDPLNRGTITLYADGTGRTNTYDVHNNRLTSSDGNGNLVLSGYDLLNRITNNAISRGPTVVGTTNESYQYDGLSRIVRAQDDDSLVTRNYNSLSHITQETQRVLPTGPRRTVTSTYGGEGNL